MNIQNLKYLVALYQKKSFTEAAKFSGISQPAISTALKNLEMELGFKIYVRNVKPVEFTDDGRDLLLHAYKILEAVEELENKVVGKKVRKKLNIGVIPTLAPYMVPKLVKIVNHTFPDFQLNMEEAKTEILIDQLKKGDLDLALMVTPLLDLELEISPIFYEEFIIYAHPDCAFELEPNLKDISCADLWLLEEGHCLRNQIMDYCTGPQKNLLNIKYNAGSMETLIHLIDDFGGKTILPDLATRRLDKEKRERLYFFSEPSPAREVSLVRSKNGLKKGILLKVIEQIKADMPNHMKNPKQYDVLGLRLS